MQSPTLIGPGAHERPSEVEVAARLVAGGLERGRGRFVSVAAAPLYFFICGN